MVCSSIRLPEEPRTPSGKSISNRVVRWLAHREDCHWYRLPPVVFSQVRPVYSFFVMPRRYTFFGVDTIITG